MLQYIKHTTCQLDFLSLNRYYDKNRQVERKENSDILTARTSLVTAAAAT